MPPPRPVYNLAPASALSSTPDHSTYAPSYGYTAAPHAAPVPGPPGSYSAASFDDVSSYSVPSSTVSSTVLLSFINDNASIVVVSHTTSYDTPGDHSN